MERYRKQCSNSQKQPSHALHKDIKYEHIHVCRLTNVYYRLVKPQEGKVLFLQLLYGSPLRAGVAVRDGVSRQREAEHRKQENTVPPPSYSMSQSSSAPYEDWWYIIKTSTDDGMCNVVELSSQCWICCCGSGFFILISTNYRAAGTMLTGGSGR